MGVDCYSAACFLNGVDGLDDLASVDGVDMCVSWRQTTRTITPNCNLQAVHDMYGQELQQSMNLSLGVIMLPSPLKSAQQKWRQQLTT